MLAERSRRFVEEGNPFRALDALAKLDQHGLGIGRGLVQLALGRWVGRDEITPPRGELPFVSLLEGPRQDQFIRVCGDSLVSDANRRHECVAGARKHHDENKSGQRSKSSQRRCEGPHHPFGASASRSSRLAPRIVFGLHSFRRNDP